MHREIPPVGVAKPILDVLRVSGVFLPAVNRTTRAAVVVALSLVGSLASVAMAEAPSARLTYSRGPGAEHCPDEAGVRNMVAARLGYDPFQQKAGTEVVATITRVRGALSARVELKDASGAVKGKREVVSAQNDCAELASSIALAISIAVDPLSLSRPLASPSASAPASASATPAVSAPPVASSAPPPPSPPAPAPESAPPPEPAPPVVVPLRVRAWLGGHVAFGAAPSAAPGASLGVGVRRGTFSLGVEGRADLAGARDVAGVGRVRASLFAGSLVPCAHASLVAACAVGSFGALQGSGEGVTVPHQKSTFYAAAGARVGLEIPVVEPLSIGVHGDLLASLTRTTLRIDGREAWISPPLSAIVGISALGTF